MLQRDDQRSDDVEATAYIATGNGDFWAAVAIVGHNPELQVMAEHCSSTFCERFAAYGAVRLVGALRCWKDFAPDSVFMMAYFCPELDQAFRHTA